VGAIAGAFPEDLQNLQIDRLALSNRRLVFPYFQAICKSALAFQTHPCK
jgi:hypothetical protein